SSVAGLLLGILVLLCVGTMASRAPPGDGIHLTTHTLAAATPSRRAALRQLLSALEREPKTKEKSLRAARVSSLLEDCAREVSLWIALGDSAEAGRASSACGAPIDGDAYVRLGEVDLASIAYARSHSVTLRSCSTHVAARRFTLAAECIRELAKIGEPG